MTLLEDIKSKFPKEIQDLILDFSNPYEDLKLVFTNTVLPSIITENAIFRLNKIKSKSRNLKNFDFLNCSRDGESFILVLHHNEELMMVYVDTNETLYWEELYDDYWEDEEPSYYSCNISTLVHHLTEYSWYDVPIPGTMERNDYDYNRERDIRETGYGWW
jgi:hypothetical protein